MHTEGKRDYIPHGAAEFRSFMFNLLGYLTPKAAEWPNIPPERIAELATSHVRFVNAMETALRTPTPANNQARREAQEETTRLLRDFVRQYLHFEPVTNVDRTEMGLPTHDYVRTPKHRPTEEVETDLSPAGIRRVTLHYRIRGASGKGKPRCAAGACVMWVVGTKAAASVEEMTHSVFSSKTPFVMTFPDADRGKIVSMAVCWENPQGEKGPWSEIISTVIP